MSADHSPGQLQELAETWRRCHGVVRYRLAPLTSADAPYWGVDTRADARSLALTGHRGQSGRRVMNQDQALEFIGEFVGGELMRGSDASDNAGATNAVAGINAGASLVAGADPN